MLDRLLEIRSGRQSVVDISTRIASAATNLSVASIASVASLESAISQLNFVCTTQITYHNGDGHFIEGLTTTTAPHYYQAGTTTLKISRVCRAALALRDLQSVSVRGAYFLRQYIDPLQYLHLPIRSSCYAIAVANGSSITTK